MVPARQSDRQGVFHRHGAGIFHGNHWDFSHGAFQPAALHALPRGPQDVSAPVGERYRGRVGGRLIHGWRYYTPWKFSAIYPEDAEDLL